MVASSSSPVAAYARLSDAAAGHSSFGGGGSMLAHPPSAPHHPNYLPYGHHQQAAQRPTAYTAYGYPYGYSQQQQQQQQAAHAPPPPMYGAAQAQAIYAPPVVHGQPSEPSSSSRPRQPPSSRPLQFQAVSPEQPFQRPRYRPAFPEHSEPDLDPAIDPFGGTSFSYAFLPAGPTQDVPGTSLTAPPPASDDRLPYLQPSPQARPAGPPAAPGVRSTATPPVKSERLSPAGSLSGGNHGPLTRASPHSAWSSSGAAAAPSAAPPDELDVQGWSGPSPNSAASSANGSARPSLGPKQSSNEESVSSAGADGDIADGGGADDGQVEIKHRRRTTRIQLEMLEDTFVVNPKPTAVERKELGSKLDMSPRAVQVWFQNRRAKLKNMAKKAAENGDPPPTLADTRTYSSSGMTAARARAAAAAAAAAAETATSSTTPPAPIPASTTPTSSPNTAERSSVPLSAPFHSNPHVPSYGPAPALPSYPTYPPPHRGQASYQHSPLNQPPQSLGYRTYPPPPPPANYLGIHGQTSSRLSATPSGGVGPERNARRRGSIDHSVLGGLGRRGSVPLLQFSNLQLVTEGLGSGKGGPRSAHHSPSNTGRFVPSASYGLQQDPSFDDAYHPGRRGSLPNFGGALPEHSTYGAGQLDIPPYYGGQVDSSPHDLLPPQPLQPSALPAHYSQELQEESSFSYGDDPEPSPQGSEGHYADGIFAGGAADGSYDGLLADSFTPPQEYYQPDQPDVVFELNSFELR